MADYLTAFASHGDARATLTTLLIAFYGVGLLCAGFVGRRMSHRCLGLAALFVAVAKLVLLDVWQLQRLQQIAVLTGVGSLLLGAGFLYARFGSRIRELLSVGVRAT